MSTKSQLPLKSEMPSKSKLPSKSELNVAICQMTSSNIVEQNRTQMLGVLEGLSDVDLVSFPENCLYMRLEDGAEIPRFHLKSDFWEPFQKAAARLNAVLHLGSVPCAEEGRTYNSTILIYPDGEIESPYQKIHLFDVDVVGHPPVRESDTFARGEAPGMRALWGWNVAFAICYDLRFSPLFAHYQIQGADLILLPAAFLVPTGKAHWEVLLRARAIETQSYVVAAAQGGSHLGKRETYGNSLAVGPWGELLARADNSPTVLQVILNQERIHEVRRQIPMALHRRPWSLV